MKKLYRKGTVHPSPPVISDHLAFLPAAILTLTAALSPEDREVLAYLISSSGNNNVFCSKSGSRQKTTFYTKNGGGGSNNDHPPMFSCDCFRCYMSYWIRWDSSPNREVIHEIIDAFEDWLLKQGNGSSTRGNKSKKDKKRKGNSQGSGELNKRAELRMKQRMDGSSSVDEKRSGGGGGEAAAAAGGGGGGGGGEEVTDKGSVRRFVSFIGERIWDVLG